MRLCREDAKGGFGEGEGGGARHREDAITARAALVPRQLTWKTHGQCRLRKGDTKGCRVRRGLG